MEKEMTLLSLNMQTHRSVLDWTEPAALMFWNMADFDKKITMLLKNTLRNIWETMFLI